MDLTPYIGWIVFLHVLGAFMFVAGHGVSMYVVFAARKEQDRGRLAALLDLSGWSIGLATIGMLVVLISGIVAGLVQNSWGKIWIWVSLALFVGIGIAMTPIGGGYLRGLRTALGQQPPNAKPGDVAPEPASDAELAALQAGNRPELLLAIGGGGFVLIVYLMIFRPI